MKRIIIKYLKLGRTKSWGWAHSDNNLVEIDVRAKGKKQLELISHECFHILFPELEEDEIERKSILLTNTLWHEGYRKTDNSNDVPMQDGTL